MLTAIQRKVVGWMLIGIATIILIASIYTLATDDTMGALAGVVGIFVAIPFVIGGLVVLLVKVRESRASRIALRIVFGIVFVTAAVMLSLFLINTIVSLFNLRVSMAWGDMRVWTYFALVATTFTIFLGLYRFRFWALLALRWLSGAVIGLLVILLFFEPRTLFLLCPALGVFIFSMSRWVRTSFETYNHYTTHAETTPKDDE